MIEVIVTIRHVRQLDNVNDANVSCTRDSNRIKCMQAGREQVTNWGNWLKSLVDEIECHNWGNWMPEHQLVIAKLCNNFFKLMTYLQAFQFNAVRKNYAFGQHKRLDKFGQWEACQGRVREFTRDEQRVADGKATKKVQIMFDSESGTIEKVTSKWREIEMERTRGGVQIRWAKRWTRTKERDSNDEEKRKKERWWRRHWKGRQMTGSLIALLEIRSTTGGRPVQTKGSGMWTVSSQHDSCFFFVATNVSEFDCHLTGSSSDGKRMKIRARTMKAKSEVKVMRSSTGRSRAIKRGTCNEGKQNDIKKTKWPTQMLTSRSCRMVAVGRHTGWAHHIHARSEKSCERNQSKRWEDQFEREQLWTTLQLKDDIHGETCRTAIATSNRTNRQRRRRRRTIRMERHFTWNRRMFGWIAVKWWVNKEKWDWRVKGIKSQTD